ncbi:uncharacterized protein LOC131942751 [Physella acuta]|uniref:uncharacterized protein LOC131942751 n=1 Tax=Physella acuta TaxID=109671 RepID=UPI0027DD0000|nr:uncharacterized protein LOC131942751 [Physella acuta]
MKLFHHNHQCLVAAVLFTVPLALFGSAEKCPDHVTTVNKGFTAVHNSICYLFVDREVYWKQARSACWDLGGEMLAIESEDAMQFVKKTLDSTELRWKRQGVWLGASLERGTWRFTNGRIMNYKYWEDGQPSQVLGPFTVETCSVMRKDSNWRWHDSICGSLRFHYNYICQFPIRQSGENRVSAMSQIQAEDNGNRNILVIIISLTICILLVMVLIVLVLHFHYQNLKKNTPEAAVHFNNDTSHSSSAPVSEQSRITTDLLPAVPKSMAPLYTEVVKPNNHLEKMKPPPLTTCNCGPALEGACGGSDPEVDTPLMKSSESFTPPPCGKCDQYVDMQSLGKGDNHTYSNEEKPNFAGDNFYESLP